MIARKLSAICICIISCICTNAQDVLETGGQKMPNEWIDKSTRHKIINISRKEGSNLSFYFHNNPFVGNKMIFYSSNKQKGEQATDMKRQEVGDLNVKNRQLYMVDLSTLKIEQLTHHPLAMSGEIVSAKNKKVYFQV